MESRRRTILIVDNNRTFVMYLGLLLRRLGFDVLTAPIRQAALELLDSRPVALVICEARTPSFDGLALLRALRERTATRDLPVIALATHSSEELRRIFMESGVTTFLNKPVTTGRLHQALHEILPFPSGKRRFPRAGLKLPVTVESSQGKEELCLVSLSEGGAFVRRSTPMKVGSELLLHLPLPEGNSLQLRALVLYNRQIFQSPDCVEPGFALQFRALAMADRERLNDFIDRELTNDLPLQIEEMQLAQ